MKRTGEEQRAIDELCKKKLKECFPNGIPDKDQEKLLRKIGILKD